MTDQSVTVEETQNPKILARQAAANQAANLTAEKAVALSSINAINSGDYLGAFQSAESYNPIALTSNQSAAPKKGAFSGVATTGSQITPQESQVDPVTQLMLSSQGLQALDPGKVWTAADYTAYYKALSDPSVNNEHLGKNPYGLWGDPTKSASDAATDYAANAGSAPNVQQYEGSQEDVSFMQRWGAPIGALAMAVLAPEIAPAMIASAGGGLAATAAVGAGLGGLTGALSSTLSSSPNFGENLLLGALGGAAGGFAKPLASGLTDAGVPSTIAGGVVKGGIGAATGALRGEVTGGDVGQSALTGGVSGAISGGIKGSGLQQGITDATGSSLVGNVATGLAASGLTSLVGSTLTSSSGKSGTSSSQLSGDSGTNQFEASSELSPGVAPVSAVNPVGSPPLSSNIQPIPANAPVMGGSTGSSFLVDVGTGLASTLGGGSLGQDLGTLLPYAGVAAIGLNQAKTGQAQDAAASAQQQALGAPHIAESNSLQDQYNTGTLNKADQAVVDTGIAQGQDTIASANGLSAIAQTAFSNYNSGKLNAGDQAALDAQTAAQKQAVRQQLSSAGITDSTILAAQDQQIDNQALISKQNTLNGYFNTGNSAYNSWLTATNEGKAAITQAQTYASTSLQTYLSNSMAEAGIGIGEVNTAIQTQMTTDAAYAAQVSTLLGTLATAYAKQIAGKQAGGGTTGSNLLGTAAKGALSGASLPKIGGGGGTGLPGDTIQQTADAGNQDASDILGQNLDNQSDIDSSYFDSLTNLGNEINSEIDTDYDLNFEGD